MSRSQAATASSEPSMEDRLALLEKETRELRALVKDLARKQAWPQYITIEQTAEMLQVSPRTLHDWVSQRRIPHHKAGNQTRFLISEIVEWTARRDKRGLRAVD